MHKLRKNEYPYYFFILAITSSQDDEMTQIDLEVCLPLIVKGLSKTSLTLDLIDNICGRLVYDVIKMKCTEWINDPDTTIGMECFWTDYLVEEIPLEFTKEQLANALVNTETSLGFSEIHVEHDRYGEHNVYIAIFDKRIIISTRDWLLRDYCDHIN